MPRPRVDDERREQILSAFERCVFRTGLAKTTLQQVADEADLPRPLVRYFVGNRSEMVDQLIARMMERAEKDLGAWPGSKDEISFDQLLDIFFEKIFTNELTNRIIDELWYLSDTDENVRTRLEDVYSNMQSRLSTAMKQEGLGQSDRARDDVAYGLMSLGYGDASFTNLRNQSKAPAMRTLADALVLTLKAQDATQVTGTDQ